MKHCSSHFHKSSILPFNYPILLRSSRRRECMRNSIFNAKGFERLIFKFSPMVTSNRRDTKTFFILSSFSKVFKSFICIIFMSKETYPSVSRLIINQNICIVHSTKTSNSSWTKQIHMYKFKWSRSENYIF